MTSAQGYRLSHIIAFYKKTSPISEDEIKQVMDKAWSEGIETTKEQVIKGSGCITPNLHY